MRKLVFLVVLCLGFLAVKGQTYTAKVPGGDWNTGTSWVGDVVPPDNAGIIIEIPSGSTISITGITVTYVNQIQVNIREGGTLSLINNGVDASLNLSSATSTVNLFDGTPAGQIASSGGFFGFFNNNTVVVGGTVGFSGSFFGGDGNLLPGPLTLDNTGQGALPIELIFFRVTQFEEQSSLTWATASEFNFDYFEIQRAIGSTDFKPIGKVSGAGEDVETIQEYSFVDEKPLNGINYFRLKSIDLDGTFEYSDIQAVKHTFDSRFDIYPNPSDGTSFNVLMDEVEEGYRIIVYDNMGLQVYESPIKGNDEAYPLPNLKAGVYTIKLLGRGGNPVQKLVVH